MKKIEEILTSIVKNNDLVTANLELDAFSYPVPGRVGDSAVERFFLYPNQPKTLKSRPYAWIVADAETGRVLFFGRCEYRDFAAELQMPMDQQVDYGAQVQCSYKDLRNMQRKFAEIYADIREFAFSTMLDNKQREILHQYMELQAQLIKPEVMQFYQMLSPEFYEWMEKERKNL